MKERLVLALPAHGTEKAAGRRQGSEEELERGSKTLDPQLFYLSKSFYAREIQQRDSKE